MPLTAAHEKLLTAFAGDCAARHLPARQHLDPGVRRARRARTAAAVRRAVERDPRRRLLRRHLGHERHRRQALRRAVVRRHAPAVLSHRPARARRLRRAAARLGRMAARARGRSRRTRGAEQLRDLPAAQRVRAAAQSRRCRATIRCSATTARAAISTAPTFRRALDFYVEMFRRGLGAADEQPGRSRTSGTSSRTASSRSTSPGPWNIGEFRAACRRDRRTSGTRRHCPAPTAPAPRSAGGASLVMFRGSASTSRKSGS